MLDFETAWTQQRDLEKLCAPQDTVDCDELYWPNNNYGNARILKTYMNWPLEKPLPAIIPHGVYTNDVYVFPGEAGAGLPAMYCYPEFIGTLWRKIARKTVIEGASPFLYLLHQIRQTVKKMTWWNRQGTIFFPVHSTAGMKADTDLEKMADTLFNLPTALHPVTVCVHWHDFFQGAHKPFVARGMRIVSAGNMNNQDFLYRWAYLLLAHRYATSNGLGSSLYYATAAGMPYFLIGETPAVTVNTHIFPTHRPMSEQMAQIMAGVEKLFRASDRALTPAKAQVAAYFLSQHKFKSPEALCREMLDIPGAAVLQ